MHIEIETHEAFLSFLSGNQYTGFAFQGLDLSDFEQELCALPIQRCFFLGCTITQPALAALSANENTIFPSLPELPFHPFRGTLYTAQELMEGYQEGNHESFAKYSIDAQIYAYFKQTKRSDVIATLMERIHDHAIDDALDYALSQKQRKERAVGIMGGHSCKRNTPRFRQIAHLGYELAKAGYFVVTGGGPGAMEAGNLGAYMSPYSREDLEEALNILEAADDYKHPLWFDTAQQVRAKWPSQAESLGVPTWFYGHEPSNLFASFIAKYFANSIREDGILAICYAGIVYAPGSAGTIQEIFQDACQNHYASCKHISPMVFLDKEYWSETKPVYPVLYQLAQGKEYGSMLGIYDDVGEIVEHIQNHPFITPDK